MSHKILVTGGRGMLGRTIARTFLDQEISVAGSKEADLSSAQETEALVRAVKPSVIIHCAAMTAVDLCETERERAFRVNALGSENIARAAQQVGARLIAISTDYVFDGKGARPYHEWDVPGPTTVYGFTKLLGEEAVRRECADHLIARVAWLYGEDGPSFVHTMRKLGAQEGPALKVVNDQVGNPTSTLAVARQLRALLDVPVKGVVHLTCEGEASWYDFAKEIFERHGFTRGVEPCTTAEFPRPAPRPANSRLEKRALRLLGLPAMPHWKEALAEFMGV